MLMSKKSMFSAKNYLGKEASKNANFIPNGSKNNGSRKRRRKKPR